MKFYDRETEVERLREIERRSHKVAQLTVVTGRRRVGKSSLILKACEKSMVAMSLKGKGFCNEVRYGVDRAGGRSVS